MVTDGDEKALLGTLRSGQWFRGGGTAVAAFEKAYAELTGAAHCVATRPGTSALVDILGRPGHRAGDEVIIPPYTFVATYNVVVLNYALPIFVDTDLESFQIDAGKIEVGPDPGNQGHLAGAHRGVAGATSTASSRSGSGIPFR